MGISLEKRELISREVIKTLYSRFGNFPSDSIGNRNAPFHKAFLNAFSDKFEGKVSDIPFFISLSSWLHGLNTTLGQGFFENIAHILSDGHKRSFTKNRNALLQITQSQKNSIADIITDLKNGNCSPNLYKENEKIFQISGDLIDANNFTVDVYIEDEEIIRCIELKSVKPNAGEMRGEKQKILEAKAALKKAYPDKTIKYYIGFPFDPTSENDFVSDKNRFLNSIIDGNKYFDQEEVLLASELWDLLSSEKNTMMQIIEIINSISKPKFEEMYNKIINPQSVIEVKRAILEEWNIYSELKLIENNEELLNKINNDKRLKRVYNSPIFKKGVYNIERYHALVNSLDN